MKNIKFVVISIFVVLFIVSSLFYYAIIPIDANSENAIIMQIPKGYTIKDVAKDLKQKKIIKSEYAFLIYAKAKKLNSPKAGNYKIYKKYSVDKILHILNEGKVYKDVVKVTIPEGFEAHQIAERLQENHLVDKDKFMYLVNNPSVFYDEFDFLKENNIQNLEGYLFPDTYLIDKGESEEQIIIMMLKQFEKVYFKKDYINMQKQMNLSLNDVITMASIIEREARKEEERPIIAGVFYNRINLNMPLQSCATVQYVLGSRKPVLSISDVKIDSPYNTYIHKGLPKGPIASPGEASINAALYPQQNDYLYFVAKKDGSHSFSKTYEEHLKCKQENEKE